MALIKKAAARERLGVSMNTLDKLIRRSVVHEEIGEDGVRKIPVGIHFNMRQPG